MVFQAPVFNSLKLPVQVEEPPKANICKDAKNKNNECTQNSKLTQIKYTNDSRARSFHLGVVFVEFDYCERQCK